MKAFTGFCVLLLAISVVENRKHSRLPRPIKYKKLFNMLANSKEDHVVDEKLGRRYQLMYDAETWEGARHACAQKGGKLATPKTMYEFKVIQRLVRRMRFYGIRGATGSKHLVWVGISSTEDWMIWKNVDGQDIRTTGFSMWVKGNGIISPDPTEPHCAGMDAVNLLRDYWCNRKQPYVCEYNIIYISNCLDCGNSTRE